jgi:hypothetical protein
MAVFSGSMKRVKGTAKRPLLELGFNKKGYRLYLLKAKLNNQCLITKFVAFVFWFCDAVSLYTILDRTFQR